MKAKFEQLERRQLMAGDFAASINFAPITAHRAPGLLTDYGAVYGVRRGGLSYGWSTDKTADGIELNATSVQKNDTYIAMASGEHFDVGVANGTYRVYIVAGDITHIGQRMALSVEGDVAIAGLTKSRKPFLEGSVTVTVADGKLTLTSIGAFGQDKINYIGIQSVADSSSGSGSTITPTSTIHWTTGAHEIRPRTEPESAVVGNKLYVFSGYGDMSTGGDGWAPSETYERYDLASNTWSILGQMPVATTHSAVAVVGTDVWFAGGYTLRPGTNNRQDIGTTNVLVYHTTTNTWGTGPALPAARASAGMALVGNTLFFVSGEPVDHHSDVTTVWALDLSSQSAGWQSKASIPQGRTHFSISAVNGKIYVLGGQTDIDENATFLKTAYSYDVAANSWTRIADLPSIRSHNSPNTVVLDGKILFFGGEYAFNYDFAEAVMYNPATNTYTQMTPLPGGRAAGAAGFIGGKIVFAGGKNNGFFSDTFIGTFA